MFKQTIVVALVTVLFQSTALAADFYGLQKSVIDNRLSEISSSISVKKTKRFTDYSSPAVFANFREIRTTGMKPNTIYRSSNPLDIHANEGRHSFADRLARQVGIQAEIDLADNDANIASYIKNSGVQKKYCYDLYQRGKVWHCKLKGNGLDSRDWENIADAFRFMLNNDGPYLVHCRLGQDRAGFFSMLSAALAGATVDDLREDYMETYCNYYHLQKHDYDYEIIRKFRGDKIIYYIAHPEYSSDKQAIPDDITVNDIVPEEAAVRFFKEALKFSDAEIYALQCKLKDNSQFSMN